MADSKLEVVVQGRDNLSPALQQMESRIIRFVGAVSSALAALEIVSMPINNAREFEREMANVKKTTEFTAAQIKELSRELLNMSLRVDVAAVDLAKVAAAAGQQGLGRDGVKGIRQFTESVSRMSSVLDITADQAANDVGKISNIFKIPLEDVEKLVSGFNEVSNNSTASGEELLDVVKRIGDASNTVDLQGSLGLAATGIDFGFSPEVVGTSVTKIFSDMKAQASEFGRLMNMSATEWVTLLEQDGIKGFKMYIQRLRELEPISRQRTIQAFSGDGRIGALVNKYVNDIGDSVLNRNLKFSMQGIESGMSAIKEQQTVLDTLDAQLKILANSFKALGIQMANAKPDPETPSWLERVTAYAAQMADALQQPKTLSMMIALGEAFADLVGVLANTVKFVASLNINWENFVTVAQVLIALKLSNYMLAAGMGAIGFSNSLKSIAADSDTAARGVERLNRSATGGLFNQNQGLRELKNKWDDYKAATLAAADAQEKLTRAQDAAMGAKGQQDRYRPAADAASAAADSSRQKASDAVASYRAAQATAAAQVEAARKARDARIEKATLDHEQRILKIQVDYLQQKAAADAAGSSKALRQAREEKARLLAEEEAHHTRSLRSIENYQRRKIAAAEQAAAAMVAAERAAARGAVGDARSAIITSNSRGDQMAGLSANVSQANAAVAVAQTRLTAAQQAATMASAALTNLGVVIRGLAGAFGVLIRVAGNVFFWFTMLYSIADALGIVSKLGGWFQTFTDKLGLTSEATRKLAEEKKKLHAEMLEEEQQLRNLIDAYEQYKNAATGALDQGKLQQSKEALQNAKGDADQKEAAKRLVDILRGSEAELKLSQTSLAKAPSEFAQKTTEANAYKDKLRELQAELARVEQYNAKVAKLGRPDLMPMDTGKLKKEIADTEALVKGLSKSAALFGPEMQKSATKAQDSLKSTAKEARSVVTGMFTPESADLFSRYILKIAELREQQRKLIAEQQTAQQGMAASKDSAEGFAAAKAKSEELTAQIGMLGNQIKDMQLKFAGASSTLTKMPGVSKSVTDSVAFLGVIAQMTYGDITSLSNALKTLKGEGAQLDGSLVPTETPKRPQGTESFEPRESKVDKAKQFAKAKLAAEKAALEAEAALQREMNDQMLASLDWVHEQGITSVKRYYDRKQELMLAQNRIEKGLKEKELAAVNNELSKTSDGTERQRLMADFYRVQGEIDVLRLKREAIVDDIDRQRKDAEREFSESLVGKKIDIADAIGGIDGGDRFRLGLMQYEAEYRVFLNQLKALSKEKPELLPVIKAMEETLKFKALGDSLSYVGQKMADIESRLQLFQSKVSLFREAGQITDRQAQVVGNEGRAQAIQALQKQIADMEATLTNSGNMGAEAYAKLATQVETARMQLLGLELTSDSVAQNINKSLEDNMVSVLMSVADGINNIGDALKAALRNIALTIGEVAARDLVQQFMQSVLGGGGNGGIGGWFSGLLQQGVAGVTANNPASNGLLNQAAGVLEPGSSPANPMYVTDVAKMAQDAASQGADLVGGKGGIVEAVKGGLETMGDKQGSQTQGMISAMLDNIGSTFSSFFGGLGGMFSQLFSFITSAISAMMTSQAASSAASSAASFHTGGVVGQTRWQTKQVSPAVFANAVRYHTGGVAGLAPDEVPAVLKKGEEVLTSDDPRHRRNGGGGEAGGGMRVVNVLDPSLVQDYLDSSSGEQVMLNIIKRNASAISGMLG